MAALVRAFLNTTRAVADEYLVVKELAPVRLNSKP